ncbi:MULTISPECIES: L-serine ammonia-lyase, iron-sulfur-dependent subunit beta [Paenibacillus]|uniref:L-serine ammonia-lyase, iron-sulfur-dependent subunit beta n=1 Tax=Paenibacillus TaxID=44249 RepID=UPI0022B92871|nr:L-serine ammonia-lyase, iron-sulfur-dependent subunit beta [Paenibacillus caseinilyticus]MCZ8520349.1 L-serine ammonia-lyase, iron-sulfur-dependent subunit beta [Paenibacillus caseinilyticus]
MRFKDVFSIIGPAMVGPSSSHTAGAVRIGRFARQLFGPLPERAAVMFYGSFAATYKGHGTDIAITGGLLDWQTDDGRIPQAESLAPQYGMSVVFRQGMGLYSHPNTVKLALSSGQPPDLRELTLTGASIGGGNIEITDIDGFHVMLSGAYPTVVVQHRDTAGMVAAISDVLRKSSCNIAHMSVDRKGRSGEALTALELDCPLSPELIGELDRLEHVSHVRMVDLARESSA